MHPVEVLGDHPGLVALQRPDQVPLDRAAQVGERGDLVDTFLNVVLAEGALASSMGSANVRRRKGLAHRQQPDRLHGPLGKGASGGDASVHFL